MILVFVVFKDQLKSAILNFIDISDKSQTDPSQFNPWGNDEIPGST